MLFHASINHNFIIFIVSDGGGTVPWVNINQMYLVTVEMFVDVIASAQKPEMLVFLQHSNGIEDLYVWFTSV